MFTPAEEVRNLLRDLRSAALRKDIREIEAKSDEIVAIMAAQLTPTLSDRWEKARLTPHEVIIADYLWERLGKIVSRDALFASLYANDPDGGPEMKIIDVYISKVRKKLDAVGSHYIETIWGRGYRMFEGSGPRATVLSSRGPWIRSHKARAA